MFPLRRSGGGGDSSSYKDSPRDQQRIVIVDGAFQQVHVSFNHPTEKPLVVEDLARRHLPLDTGLYYTLFFFGHMDVRDFFDQPKDAKTDKLSWATGVYEYPVHLGDQEGEQVIQLENLLGDGKPLYFLVLPENRAAAFMRIKVPELREMYMNTYPRQ